MAKSPSPLQDLIIRTAVVRRPGLGFIYAGDPKREEEEIPHTVIFKWKEGTFDSGECEYDASTACFIEQPEYAIVDASEPGYYSANARSGMTTDDIFQNSQPPPKTPRIRGIRAVAAIAGKAYAVGLRGMVYRMDGLRQWTRIDDGLPDTFDIQGIHGFDATDIYAIGRQGNLWHYNSKRWKQYELPTNVNLTSVECAGDEKVYIAGHRGVLIRGRGDVWELIEQEETTDDLWDLAWFEGVLYVANFTTVYRLENDELAPVDFGDDSPVTTCQLSAAKGVLWSIGDHDVMSYDGKKWTRVV